MNESKISDDSSNDESFSINKGETCAELFKKFQKSDHYKYLIETKCKESDIKLSFIAHCIGIACLYSNSVQLRYEQMKSERLTNKKDESKRRTLGENSTFDITETNPKDFPIEFFASIRLHNRSEKNHIKNEERCTNTKWKLQNDGEEQYVTNNNIENI